MGIGTASEKNDEKNNETAAKEVQTEIEDRTAKEGQTGKEVSKQKKHFWKSGTASIILGTISLRCGLGNLISSRTALLLEPLAASFFDLIIGLLLR